MTKPRVPRRAAKVPRPVRRNLEDAKARLSEIVREAKARRPQNVTQRGHEAVANVAADKFGALIGTAPGFVVFMAGLGLDGLTLERGSDIGRKVDL